MWRFRRVIRVIAITMMAVTVTNTHYDAIAQNYQPPQMLGSIHAGPLSAKIEEVVNLAFDEKTAVPDLQAFYERLNDEQKKLFAYYVSQKAGIDFTKSPNAPNLPSATRPPLDKGAAARPRQLSDNPTTLLIGVRTQNIENVWTWTINGPFADYYYNDPNCDENGDPDSDFVFRFSLQSSNPDGIRWTTTSALVYSVFQVAYGGILKGFAYNFSETRLCIGPDGVSAAGGANHMRNGVFVHY